MMSKMIKRGLWLTAVLLLLIVARQVGAQSGGSYHLYWSSLEAGGGTSSDGVFTLRGTLNQENSTVASGGSYTVIGRLWGQFINNVESPPNAAPPQNYFTTQEVTLTWNRVTDATAYQVQISRNSTFTDIVYTNPELNANTLFVVTSALDSNIYYWRVRAKNMTNQWGAWSVYDSFVVNAP